MGDVIIGLDLGTGGVRPIAVDLHETLVAQFVDSYPLLTQNRDGANGAANAATGVVNAANEGSYSKGDRPNAAYNSWLADGLQ